MGALRYSCGDGNRGLTAVHMAAPVVERCDRSSKESMLRMLSPTTLRTAVQVAFRLRHQHSVISYFP